MNNCKVKEPHLQKRRNPSLTHTHKQTQLLRKSRHTNTSHKEIDFPSSPDLQFVFVSRLGALTQYRWQRKGHGSTPKMVSSPRPASGTGARAELDPDHLAAFPWPILQFLMYIQWQILFHHYSFIKLKLFWMLRRILKPPIDYEFGSFKSCWVGTSGN